jgi:uncharacterized protein
MKNKKIILAGGSGFIGQEMIGHFGKENSIVVLTRQLPDPGNNRNQYSSLSPGQLKHVRMVKWDGRSAGSWARELEDADILINLAGKSVNCRYTPANKKEILNSRTNAVKAITAALQQTRNPPRLWINASSATFYRHATDRPQDEYTGETGTGFSVDVCKAWEDCFYEKPVSGVRKVALRMAITLGAGGVLIPYFNLLKFGLGGRQGSGDQQFSWVHSTDTCRMIEWIDADPSLEGTYNCSSPFPVTNKELMYTLRRLTNTRFGLPAYTWMLKAGAWLIGTETELVLKSRWVLPARIQDTGFIFSYPRLEDALKNIIAQVPRAQYRLF